MLNQWWATQTPWLEQSASLTTTTKNREDQFTCKLTLTTLTHRKTVLSFLRTLLIHYISTKQIIIYYCIYVQNLYVYPSEIKSDKCLSALCSIGMISCSLTSTYWPLWVTPTEVNSRSGRSGRVMYTCRRADSSTSLAVLRKCERWTNVLHIPSLIDQRSKSELQTDGYSQLKLVIHSHRRGFSVMWSG